MHWISPGSASLLAVFKPFPLVSGRSSAYGDATAEGHPAGPGSVSSSTGAISTQREFKQIFDCSVPPAQ